MSKRETQHSRRDFLVTSGALIATSAVSLGGGFLIGKGLSGENPIKPTFTPVRVAESITPTATPETVRPTPVGRENQLVVPGWHTTERAFWEDANWYPMDPVVAKRLGLSTMYDPNGPLSKYDLIATRLTGRVSRARQANADSCADMLRNHPQDRGWMGYCAALARAGILYKEPRNSVNNYQGTGVDVSVANKKGILTMLASGKPAVEISKQELLKQYSGELNQRIYVARIGNYFRIVIGVSGDNSNVLVTDFGNRPLAFTINQVSSLWLPVASYDNVRQDIISQAQIWRNPELDENLAKAIAG